MKKKTAVILDLGFVNYSLYRAIGNRIPTAKEVHAFAKKCVDEESEELFRVYAYHCPPYDGSEQHPITREMINFKETSTYMAMTKFLRELALMDNVAFRAGEISFDGWVVKKHAARKIARSARPLQADDFSPDLKQKRVDIKIGLDIAWLASKGIVDRIILVTGDSDFIPAMKFARREGVQIILVSLSQPTKVDLKIHADELREVIFP